jgi:hypothetical protein
MPALSTYSIKLEETPQQFTPSPKYTFTVSCEGSATLCFPNLTASKLGVRSDAAARLLATAIARSVTRLSNCASPLLAQFALMFSDAIHLLSRLETTAVGEFSSLTLCIDDPVIHRQVASIAVSCGMALRQPPDMIADVLPLVHLLCTFSVAKYRKKQGAINTFYSAVGWHTLRTATDTRHLHQTQSAYSKLWPPYGSAIEYIRSGPGLDPKHACLEDANVREAAIVFIEREAIEYAIYNAVMYYGSDAFAAGDYGGHEIQLIVRSQAGIINNAIQAVCPHGSNPVIC